MKKNVLNIIVVFLFFSTLNCFSQQTFYKLPDGKIINQTLFDDLKGKVSKIPNFKIEFYDEILKNDSLIKSVVFKIPEKLKNSNDPYAIHRKKIGQSFDLSMFKNVYGNFYKSDYLVGKPSIINFWFTRCPPCIEEIPILNRLEAKYKDKVNFIAITFDEKEKVAVFLNSKTINFEHITNAEMQLDKMKIEAFPMNLILDKEGKIIQVFGDVIQFEKTINNLLSAQLEEK
jgi:cytochrome c biogenesis protein CcmG, thiol:disulfide interchange protein DsbE